MFWNELTEPLRKNRWKITFTRTGLKESTWLLKKCDKPSYKTTDITHKFGNYSWYYPGRVEWNTINMTFAGTETLNRDLVKLLSDAGFALPFEEQAALKAASKKKFVDSVGAVVIQQIDYLGATLEEWTLKNPFFTNIKFGDLSYDSEEIVDVECTVRFDTAEQKVNTTSEI